MKKDTHTYVEHILEFTNRISKHISGKSKEDFLKERMLQDAIIWEIEVIEEVTKNISIEFKNKHPDIEWKKMEKLRQVIIPEFFKAELDAAYETATQWIPELKIQIEKLLRNQ